MKPVTIYSTRVCGYCIRAKALLQSKHVAYTEYLVDLDPVRREEMLHKSQRRTVPQIFIGEQHVGGYHELYELDSTGGLDKLLAD
ncbi:MAG: glutaredoxin 3 [Gammaproteobacteria bacterium]|nr:glutaredoxin 3 [Gammaproteobacteria bacterium]